MLFIHKVDVDGQLTINKKSWNYMHLRKWLQMYHFWLNYRF